MGTVTYIERAIANDAALTKDCQCAEVQKVRSPEKWQDLTFDEHHHCSKCSACGRTGPVPYSRFRYWDGAKVWRFPQPDGDAA